MNDSTAAKTMTIDNIDRQRKYVDAQRLKGHGLGIVFADAFLRGMRDLGYKNPAWALAEQIDNSFQAAADTVCIRIGYDSSSKSQSKPDQVAMVDNGNGMIAEMIGYAVRWGGTDREGDRTGFGRYGYGLPSSAVSLAKRYTVYSKPKDGDWHAVTVDIEQLAEAAGDVEKTQRILTAQPAKLPEWVVDAKKGDDSLDLGTMKSGTVVVFEDLDRLRKLGGWIKSDSLRTKLLQHFGVIYRHWLPERRIVVDGVAAQAVDPLFLMEHGRLFDETAVRAERIETRTIQVKTSRGSTGAVTIRAAFLPPHFQLADPKEYGRKGAKNNKRFEVMKDYNGLLICRQRRQIDCVSPPWTKFQNQDLNVKIEIDFDPELDEYFGITTAKQQIVIDEEMWQQLKHNGKNGGAISDLIKDLRGRFDDVGKELKAKAQNQANADEPRPSVVAMEASEKFKGATVDPTPTQVQDAQRNLEQAAEKEAERSGKPKEVVLQVMKSETAKKRWEIEFLSIPEGPFYRPVRLGEQKRLVINTDHPFYTKIYEPGPEVRPALEVVLFVLAERELDVRGEGETFYKAERQRWSERLRHALDSLTPDQSMVDKASAVAEQVYMAETEAPAA